MWEVFDLLHRLLSRKHSGRGLEEMRFTMLVDRLRDDFSQALARRNLLRSLHLKGASKVEEDPKYRYWSQYGLGPEYTLIEEKTSHRHSFYVMESWQ